jgi:hypothetical protein
VKLQPSPSTTTEKGTSISTKFPVGIGEPTQAELVEILQCFSETTRKGVKEEQFEFHWAACLLKTMYYHTSIPEQVLATLIQHQTPGVVSSVLSEMPYSAGVTSAVLETATKTTSVVNSTSQGTLEHRLGKHSDNLQVKMSTIEGASRSV